MIIIGLIILHFIIGLIVATVVNVKGFEDDRVFLAAICVLWEFVIIGLIVLAICYVIGYIPKSLGKMIKEMRK